MVSCPTIVATSVSALALVLLFVLPVSFNSIVGEVPREVTDSLPFTSLCGFCLLLFSAVAPALYFLAGSKGSKGLCLGAIGCTAFAMVLAVEVLVCAVIFIHIALPLLWKAYPKQCHSVPHAEAFGHVITQGCTHECAASISEMVGISLKAALQVVGGGMPSLTVPGLKAQCVPEVEWDGLQSMVSHNGKLLMVTLLSLVSTFCLQVVALCCGFVELATLKSAEARDRTKVQPLLGQADGAAA
eukprot:CAMPEP_0117554174 /NCGR_PEP_ID=MMETSP0784-20121206/50618_1 /TAXON_ID=39447 /ORGANISM="" /LENGTH=242 /DNA_ID=CAMNT_0005351331 /DNA_START=91 /DNA_END=819 /DNA_ORIENTATION=+